MRAGVEILVGMSLFSKYLVGDGTINILRDENIKEGKSIVDFLFHSELNGGGLFIKMTEEEIQLIMTMRPNDTSVIYKSLPKLWQETG